MDDNDRRYEPTPGVMDDDLIVREYGQGRKPLKPWKNPIVGDGTAEPLTGEDIIVRDSISNGFTKTVEWDENGVMQTIDCGD